MISDTELLVTAQELAERYRVTSRTIRRWSESGILPTPFGPTPCTLRWYAEDIKLFEDWQAARRQAQAESRDPDSVGASFAEYAKLFDLALASSPDVSH